MSAVDLQSLLRFLTKDAKLPLALAMSKVKDLQAANLDSPESIAKVKPDALRPIFEDEKISKQIISAAKRLTKKRSAGELDDNPPTPKKKCKAESLFTDQTPLSPTAMEFSLTLPTSSLPFSSLSSTCLITNRAPLVLAFLVTLLKYTMPEQPLSSRLSLAQAYVSQTSKKRAIYLGIEDGKTAEEEGFGEGLPQVVVGGKEVKVLRRWGYEWRGEGEVGEVEVEGKVEEGGGVKVEEGDGGEDGQEVQAEEKPALWALDLEALKKTDDSSKRSDYRIGTYSNLPIHTPQSARAYIMKAFASAPSTEAATTKKPTAKAAAAEKEANLGKLLRALDLLYESWATTLSAEELDARTWGWYVKVRPSVEDGVAGWGGKNVLKLGDILALRRAEAD
ncbi:uncharacterized protein MYCGRDRAFT_37741 [Zymoseptoria tritici IPO323]|uniref:Impact N-terminal domain-containing protein n=1 Tax=Zymoseptoria tritici (strain CBS 115943 / IPO323) TaxID=336722 RepID=F9X5F1_ZYMTI|nr:uncharacterized protein MYCGRDRAFT_37741 [Zymoseptoria tritici IPO323]EGP89635.1 hypothetical protein MYCGRDRAFT_37741 [Zymoseptoria tritici IPO323]